MKENPPFLPWPWMRHILWVGFAGWAATIWMLSALSSDELPPVEMWEHMDKVIHAIAYCAGACVFAMALRATVEWNWQPVILATIVALALYGWLDELHQVSTPGRSGQDVWDWCADFVGAMIGAGIIYFIYGWARRSEKAD